MNADYNTKPPITGGFFTTTFSHKLNLTMGGKLLVFNLKEKIQKKLISKIDEENYS